jgi:DNA-directed RNA polymerase alpha subunit
MIPIQILTKRDVEKIAMEILKRETTALAQKVMHEMETRLPEPGPVILKPHEPVEMLALSNRARRALEEGGIHTIADLSAKTETELLRLRRCGRLTIIEIKTRLAWHGHRLAV